MDKLIVNVETTSIFPEDGSIVEIAGLLVKSKNDYEPVFNYIVKPKSVITGDEWIFHHNRYITPEILKHGIDFDLIREDIQDLFDITEVFAWNCKFDFDWLESYGLTIPNKGKDLKTGNKHLSDCMPLVEYPSALMECYYAVLTL